MTIYQEVVSILSSVLQLDSSVVSTMTVDTPLLGAIPEFDSMAVVSVITALEEQFGFFVDDDEIDADVFETIDTLVSFAKCKLADL